MELKLKITIIAPSPGEEEEIIFRCHTLTDEMKQLVYRLEHGDMKLTGYDENGIYPLEASDVYYLRQRTTRFLRTVRGMSMRSGKSCISSKNCLCHFRL